GNGRCDRKVFVVDDVALRDAALGQQHVQARRAGGAEVDAGVEGHALVVRRAVAGGHGRAEIARRLFRDQVDVARSRATADVGTGRTFRDFDLLEVEGVAADGAEV